MSIVLNSHSLQSMGDDTSKLPTKGGLQSFLSFEQWLRVVWEDLPETVLKIKNEQMITFPFWYRHKQYIRKNMFIQFRSLETSMRNKRPAKAFNGKQFFYNSFSRTQTSHFCPQHDSNL